ncbi:MAG: DNA cytosine methyltransferase [Firmicutes bacterium]|nr:DNA cytosine methyltransferase [Bacillota bacterium]
MSYPTFSLFTGAGGLDIGLEKAGFEVRACVEIDDDCRRTLQTNTKRMRWGNKVRFFRDINEITANDLLQAAKLLPGEAYLLAGGPPCQSFSTAGNRQSIRDPRGSLLYKYVEMVGDTRPRFFVFENVRGILSAAIKHRPLKKRGPSYPPLEPEEELGSLLKQVILPLFRDELGYEVVFGLVSAADYGVPQDRQRVLFIGSRDRELGTEPYARKGIEMPIKFLLPPTHNRKGKNGLPTWKTLGDALEGLHDPKPEYTPYSPARKQVFELIPPGHNWRYIRDNFDDEFTQKVMGGAYSSSGGRVGFWRRLSFDKHCPTLVTSPTQKATGLCHPIETRPLSVREYARIQQFSDEYEFAGTTASKYRQIGNAVPIGLSHYVGKRLIEIIETDSTEDKSAFASVI